MTAQNPVLAAGVNHETGKDPAFLAGMVLAANSGRGLFSLRPPRRGGVWIVAFARTEDLVVKQDFGALPALAHVHPIGHGIIQKDMVKGRTPYLVGVGIAAVGLAEEPTPRLPFPPPDHGRAPLLQKSLGLHFGQNAQFFQDGNAGGKERLPHMVTGEAFTLQQGDRPALAGQHSGGCTAGGATANYHYIC